MYNKKTIEDIDCKGKRVLVRCDFNVPMKDGVITDNKRIVEALPTIKYLSSNGAKLILLSLIHIFSEQFSSLSYPRYIKYLFLQMKIIRKLKRNLTEV